MTRWLTHPLILLLLIVPTLAAQAAEPDLGVGGGVVPAAPQELARDLAEARRLEATGHATEAAALLGRATATEWPCRDLAWILLGRARLTQGDAAGAVEAALRAESAVEDGVRVADALWLRAEALEKVDAAAAVEAHRSFAAKWPDDPRAADSAARVAAGLEAAKKDAEAAAAWRRALTTRPDHAPADAWERASRLAKAAGVALAPLSSAERVDLAERLAKANLHERAADAWHEAGRGAKGEAAARAAVERARSLYLLRRNDEARATCEDALLEHPASPVAAECHLIVARVASRSQDRATLRKHAEKALADARWKGLPWRTDAGLLLAGSLADEGKWDEAAATYERTAAGAGEERRAEVQWRAAWCLLKGGKAKEAATAWLNLSERVGLEADAGRNALLWYAIAKDRALDAQARLNAEARSAEEASGNLSTGGWGGDLGGWTHLQTLYGAKPWTYHGQQARALLGRCCVAGSLAVIDSLALDSGVAFEDPGPPELSGPHAVRFELLKGAGLDQEALDEIEAMKSSSDSKAFLFALASARARGGEADRAQALLAKTFPQAVQNPSRRSPPAFWEVVYPRPRFEIVERGATKAGIDPAFACSIIRAESFWKPEVRSTADARGLMQLIPDTARRMAKIGGPDDFDPEQLFDPETNVLLGTRLLGQLVALFDGDESAAAAAYNAGEQVVAKWWAGFEKDGVVLLPERIESIPYRETRGYVKRVSEAAGWYRWLDGCDDRALPATTDDSAKEASGG